MDKFDAVYLRVSTDEQKERQTIENQRIFAEKYLASLNITAYEWYKDDGISGTIPLDQRPAGSKLLKDARDGKIRYVYVYRLDRLGRENEVTHNAVNRLKKHGVLTHSMTESFDVETPNGKLMLGMLSTLAAYERDSLIQRSVEGTNRLARAGAWLGGIVPYGYIVEGRHQSARLLPSEHPIQGLGISEADVIRLMYDLTVVRNMTTQQIADHFNALGIPPVYIRDNRHVLRGKRTQATQGIWRAGRIRNMIVETTYKGVHRYGKRSKKKRDIIEREVPALVSVEMWEAAQQALRNRMIASPKNRKRLHLLRSLVKCGCCELTYSGYLSNLNSKGGAKLYYKCNGSAQYRGLYGSRGERCPSKNINGHILENKVWSDVERYLRNPGEILNQLAERAGENAVQESEIRAQLAQWQQKFEKKTVEKHKVISWGRKGLIDETAVVQQLDEIRIEEQTITNRIDELQARLEAHRHQGKGLDSAQQYLAEIRKRLSMPLTEELKFELIHQLVDRITIYTEIEDGKKTASAHVVYRFSPAPKFVAATRTDMGSWLQ